MQFGPLYTRWRSYWIPQQFNANQNLQNVAYVSNFSEVITLVDSLNRFITVTLTEVFTLIDLLKRAITVKFSEVLTLIDLFKRGSFYFVAHEMLTLVDLIFYPVHLVLTDVLNLVDNFNIRNILDTALNYFRHYLLDIKSVVLPSFAMTVEVTVTPDVSVTYFRQYLGRI